MAAFGYCLHSSLTFFQVRVNVRHWVLMRTCCPPSTASCPAKSHPSRRCSTSTRCGSNRGSRTRNQTGLKMADEYKFPVRLHVTMERAAKVLNNCASYRGRELDEDSQNICASCSTTSTVAALKRTSLSVRRGWLQTRPQSGKRCQECSIQRACPAILLRRHGDGYAG